MIRTFFLVIAVAALNACGLQPMYAGGGSGTVATSLRSIQVQNIPGKGGWLVRNALISKLGGDSGAAPTFRLDVELDDNITGYGIRGDRAVTRERRTLRARFRLIELVTGSVVLDATAGSDAGIDVVSSQYATIAAEQTALERLSEVVSDQIVSRLALYVARTAPTR
jgi:LPS-assembly lipoprotein